MSNEKPGPVEEWWQKSQRLFTAADVAEAAEVLRVARLREMYEPRPAPHVELTVTTDPRDFGATHRLRGDDGTEELLTLDGEWTLERLP